MMHILESKLRRAWTTPGRKLEENQARIHHVHPFQLLSPQFSALIFNHEVHRRRLPCCFGLGLCLRPGTCY
jgi:hypothetical protein